jgi:hypothetical protein
VEIALTGCTFTEEGTGDSGWEVWPLGVLHLESIAGTSGVGDLGCERGRNGVLEVSISSETRDMLEGIRTILSFRLP